jgi:hypothetical protein
MDKDQKRSNSECYTPSSEPIKIYKFTESITRLNLYSGSAQFESWLSWLRLFVIRFSFPRLMQPQYIKV